MRASSIERPSTIALIGEAVAKASELISAEVSLARLELSEKLVAALVAIASIVVAAIFLIVALIFLLQGVVAFLVHLGWAPFSASFAVGGAIALVALVAILVAVRQLSAARLAPSRTIRQIKDTAAIAKGPAS